jgi:Flp pilus assembly secretin CpaC
MYRLAVALAGATATIVISASETSWAQAPRAEAHLAVRANDPLRVAIDEARIIRLDQAAHAVVVGNPAIADAIVHDGRSLIITARAYGATNLIVLDRAGNVMLDRMVHVTQPQSALLTIQRGNALETYSCAPHCRRMPMPGDTATFFEEIIKQNQSRNGLVQSQIGR